jgi:hypothetical protein
MARHEFPVRALEIAAKAGFITKELWREHVFGEVPESVNSKRRYHWAWKSLTQKGYLRPHPNRHLSNVLILGHKKLGIIREHFGVASRSPYESQFHHDELLLRGVLQVEKTGLLRHWTLESELKSSERDEFKLTSQGKKLKYPDAILYFSGSHSERKVAVELELTLKNRLRYRQIIGAYWFLKELPMILFVTATPAIERAIRETIRDNHAATASGRFGFMSLDQWQRGPAEGEIVWNGERTTLRKIAMS